MKLTDSQLVFLREAVEAGETFPYHHTQRRPIRGLLKLGFLRRQPDPPGSHILCPLYYPTARGRAYFHWWTARFDRTIHPFVCPPGGTIKPYRR